MTPNNPRSLFSRHGLEVNIITHSGAGYRLQTQPTYKLFLQCFLLRSTYWKSHLNWNEIQAAGKETEGTIIWLGGCVLFTRIKGRCQKSKFDFYKVLNVLFGALRIGWVRYRMDLYNWIKKKKILLSYTAFQLQFPLPPLLLMPPSSSHLPQISSSSISIQKRTDPQWILTKYVITSYNNTRHISRLNKVIQ